MTAPRQTATDSAVQWDSSRTVARGVSSGVEARRARALGADNSRDKVRDKRSGGGGGGSKPPQQGSSGNETLANILGLVWIALGGIVIVLCTVFVVGSVVMFGVLREISDARNYDDAASRIASYEDFFKQAGEAGFTVGNDKPNIQEGVTKYLWTVVPPNDGSMRVFSWQHDLQSNEVRPTSNAAALLDIELGNLDRAKAEEFAQADGHQVFQFDPNDTVANAIIDRNTSAFAKSNGTGWGGQPLLANAPKIGDPLFDVHARSRKSVGGGPEPADETAAAETDPNAPADADKPAEDGQPPKETTPGEDPQPPTEVEPAKPPEDGGGDGKGDGDNNGNGKQPKPKPEPGDGEGDGDGNGDATPVG